MFLLVVSTFHAFLLPSSPSMTKHCTFVDLGGRKNTIQQPKRSSVSLCTTLDNANGDDKISNEGKEEDSNEDEQTPPGKMKASEIKAELDLRGVSYAGVFERSELESLLNDARLDGAARPEILEAFNEQYNEKQRKKFEDAMSKQANDMANENIDWDKVTASDGTLPGGVKKEDMEKLTQNEELMALLANPKLQEFMQAIMKKDMVKMGEFSKDPEVMEIVTRFQELSKETGFDLSKMGGVQS